MNADHLCTCLSGCHDRHRPDCRAARQDARDYMMAGRSLPLYMNVATVFATWFGAETVLSVSATFAKDGLSGIPGDPFGASVCLVLAACCLRACSTA
jgi:Na+/proline symporter